MAYDWPGYREPSQHPVKGLATGRPLRVLFVGNMHPAKGLGELLLAVGLLRKRGLDVELTAVGDGPALSSFKAKAKRVADGCVTFVGRRSNDDAFALMRDSAVLCVPTRPSFAEGMPFVIREGLASRTPVLVSDHPVFASAFREGEGIRYFVAGDASSLADSLGAVLSDPAAYAALSAATENAFERTRCGMLFSDVIRAWNV
jgi:glycosyltransferase involved in cell wall biosynthesis